MNPFIKWVSGIIIKFLLGELSGIMEKAVKSQESTDKTGEEKREAVLNTIKDAAKERGKSLPQRFLNFALEAAVYKYAN